MKTVYAFESSVPVHEGVDRLLTAMRREHLAWVGGGAPQSALQSVIADRHFNDVSSDRNVTRMPAAEFGSADLDRLVADLGQVIYQREFDSPPDFSVVDAARRADVVAAYRYLEKGLLLTNLQTDQAGIGALISTLRHRAISAEADPDTGCMPRMFMLETNGIGYRISKVVATFPAVDPKAHQGHVELALDGQAAPFARVPVAHVTGYGAVGHSIDALGRLHRFGRYGEGQSTYGDWFSPDGHGRELLAAMVAGLVNRVLPDTANGMGGVSPNFALTTAGVQFVLQHPKLPGLFDHYNQIETCTAFLAGPRVPFDTRTGAVLGQLDDYLPFSPAYVTRSALVGVEAGKTYARGDLGYLLADKLEARRSQQIQVEDAPPRPAFVELSEEAFDAQFVLVVKDDSSTMHDHDEVKDLDPHYVWTVVEGDADDVLYTLPGFHHVNRVGYVVTEKPWPHENIQGVYCEALDADERHEFDDDGEGAALRP